MKETELRSLVLKFRKGILGKRGSRNECFKVCAALQGYLGCIGYYTELTKTDIRYNDFWIEHYYLKMEDGTIIDPTIDQFQWMCISKLPKVYIGKHPFYAMTLSTNPPS